MPKASSPTAPKMVKTILALFKLTKERLRIHHMKMKSCRFLNKLILSKEISSKAQLKIQIFIHKVFKWRVLQSSLKANISYAEW